MMTDEMLYRAAKQVNTAIVEHWEHHEVEEHSFSLRFERRIRRLTRKANNPQVYRFLNKAACLLLTALISFAAVMSFNVEARAAFVRWVKTIYEDQIIYEFFGEREDIDISSYRVTWVPEGYELVEEFETDTIYGALYRKGESVDDVCVVQWYLISEDRKVAYQTSGFEYDRVEVSVNGCEGEFYGSTNDTESNGLIWIDEKRGVGFDINTFLSKDETLKIAESIIYDPPQQTATVHDYHVTWVPEGYEIVDEYVLDLIYSALYENSDGSDERDGFVIEWSCVEDGDNIALVTYGEEYQCEDIKVNGYRGNFYQSLSGNDSNVLIWVNEQEMIEYHVNSYLPFEQMLKIAESIMPVEKGKDEYSLGYIPLGYTEKTNIQEENYTTVIYSNADGKQLTFNYTRGSDSTKLFLSTQGHEIKIVHTMVDQYDANVYVAIDEDSRNDIVWIGENDICFRISAYMSVDELKNIAESVQKVK